MIEELPKTLLEAVRYFSDLDTCNELMTEIKWPRGTVICPKCEHDGCSPVKGRSFLQCNKCRKQFSLKTGTMIQKWTGFSSLSGTLPFSHGGIAKVE